MGLQRGRWARESLAPLTLLLGCLAVAVGVAVGPSEAAPAQTNPPTQPSTFFGTVTAPDGEVAGGLDVVAYIGDAVCSQEEPQQTIRTGEDGEAVTNYRVDVLSAQEKEGCGADETLVRFKIGDRFAQETGIWRGQPQELNLTLPAGPTEPEETPEGTETTVPEEPVEPEETPEGTETTVAEEPVEPEESPEATETTVPEEPEESPEATETTETVEPEASPEPTEAAAATEVAAEETPEATEAPEATEEPAATATPAPTATEAPEPTEAPAATEPPAATEAATPAETPAPAATEPESDGGTDGALVVIIVLAVVAGLAAAGVVVFYWLGRPPGTSARTEYVIGVGPATRSTSIRDSMGTSVRDLLNRLQRRR